ncbi:hypothetical protein CQA53_06025 [Helicobacter didelphidarum]|uniref:TonB C-terminal domain-containing protein n=1 Tax=Helicobacter didelphidarum TaxID=2040648 RepID=A0A3D8ILD5_9HELI|nr:hypothetical protein [Helicobacter didelphidarum]RDU65716.1 hypothetical protein CQA53_06025 [Helicobacter didelphidarum]
MDIILAMLASNDAPKFEEKKWGKFPYNIQKNLEVSQNIKNFALYRYLVNNSLRYPKEWIENKAGASVVASVAIHSQNAMLQDVKIVNKTQGLTDDVIVSEVQKTLQRASHDFPNTESSIVLRLPLEWKS